jgi:hypothetical protein
MRFKILSGLAVGLLATVGVAGPAQAISPTTSDVYVVHGIPGLVVDVYVNDDLTLEDFTFGTVAGPLDLPAGNYKIQVFAANDDPATDTPAIDVPAAAVPANKSVSLVAQFDAAGDPKLGVFVNDISTIPAGQGRLTVRHTAEAGAVAIVANGAIAFDDVKNGDEGMTLLPVGGITAGVAGKGTTSPLVIPKSGTAAPITIAEGVNLIVYAVGPADDLQLITQSISGLHSTPGGVHSGTAGLAADNNPTVIGLGAAGVLALLLAAGLIAMRVRARSTNN